MHCIPTDSIFPNLTPSPLFHDPGKRANESQIDGEKWNRGGEREGKTESEIEKRDGISKKGLSVEVTHPRSIK